jgi:hypothetical protein
VSIKLSVPPVSLDLRFTDVEGSVVFVSLVLVAVILASILQKLERQ